MSDYYDIEKAKRMAMEVYCIRNKNNASVDFSFDVKALKYYMYVNVYFKNYTRQYKIEITQEEFDICSKEELKNE